VVGCRYGVGDSVGLAVQLEKRYRGVRSPHKFKGGVSGCVRECAEAQGKDFGVIATDKGWNSAFNFQQILVLLISSFELYSFCWRKWWCYSCERYGEILLNDVS
jgi:dissimilatory sulfite reductase (desulfoviridin) alpha/beta subunit